MENLDRKLTYEGREELKEILLQRLDNVKKTYGKEVKVKY